jgi:hypothetical protein
MKAKSYGYEFFSVSGTWHDEHWRRDLAHRSICDASSDLRVRRTSPCASASQAMSKSLTFTSDGYDVCYVTIPERSLGDAQVNAEYVAYNIQDLAAKSSTGKIYVIGHSQGNLNIQWALAFWPSLRSKVLGFGSVAGDFFGKQGIMASRPGC